MVFWLRGRTLANRGIFIVQLSTSEPHRIHIAHYFTFLNSRLFGFATESSKKNEITIRLRSFVHNNWIDMTAHCFLTSCAVFYVFRTRNLNIISDSKRSVRCVEIHEKWNHLRWQSCSATTQYIQHGKYITQYHEMIKPFGSEEKRIEMKTAHWSALRAMAKRKIEHFSRKLISSHAVAQCARVAIATSCYAATLPKLISYICYETMRSILMFIFNQKKSVRIARIERKQTAIRS